MNKFRVHHILCTNLYQGIGYSGAFCENMTRVVGELRACPEKEVKLVCEPDMICANCPNLTSGGGCRQDSDHVAVKDELLRGQLGLEKGKNYTYWELCQAVSDTLTEKAFLESCINCMWYQQGLCDYRALMENIKKLGQ